MAPLPEVLGDLRDALSARIEAKGVPGASAAVLFDGQVVEAAAGVLNLRTGVEATPDSLFQIGSITKVYTASLVMQLVDAGSVELDAPVRLYLPEFAVADAEASEAITVRHLLSHTAGFDGGDFFYDGGRGDDTLARYVAALAQLDQLSAPGEIWSYNNAGFTVLGRLVEVVTGQLWDDALRERLVEPAGLDHSVTFAEDALLFRTAGGHQPGEDGEPRLVRKWGLNRSAGPAGIICASAADVVAFARIHLEDGKGLLSPASVKAMQEEQVRFPGETEAGCGLGWIVRQLDGAKAIGHNGGTVGQLAFLTAVPERGFAMALLTNGTSGVAVWQEMCAHVTDRLGLPSHTPVLPKPPAEPPDLDLALYAGRYERRAVHTTVYVEDGKLLASVEYVDVPYDLTPPPPMPLTPVDAETFVVLGPDGEPVASMHFLDFGGDGRPQKLFAARLSRRVG